MTDRLLNGEVLIDDRSYESNDRYMFETWYHDINNNMNMNAAMLEINAKLLRFCDSYRPAEESYPGRSFSRAFHSLRQWQAGQSPHRPENLYLSFRYRICSSGQQ